MFFYNARNEVIGEYNTSHHVYVKIVHNKKGAGRKIKGWAVEAGAIDTLALIGCEEIQFIDKNANNTYVSSFENFTKNGEVVPGKYGDEIFLAEEYWVVRQIDA